MGSAFRIRDIVGKSNDILLAVLRHQKYDISSNSVLLTGYCNNWRCMCESL